MLWVVYAEGCIFIVMLIAIMPSVVMLKVAAPEATGVLQNYCNFFSTQNKKVFLLFSSIWSKNICPTVILSSRTFAYCNLAWNALTTITFLFSWQNEKLTKLLAMK
jgi:hypothetical protein